jgi:hypothetical protein
MSDLFRVRHVLSRRSFREDVSSVYLSRSHVSVHSQVKDFALLFQFGD